MPKTLAVLPLARPTFDVAFAESTLAAMLGAIDRAGRTVIGPRNLLFETEATRAALDAILVEAPDFLLILQVTFTDAAVAREIAERFDGPLGFWAVPEPRTGGRLRLNSFCGLNLASHALGRREREFSWLYGNPVSPGIDREIGALLDGCRRCGRIVGQRQSAPPGRNAEQIAASLRGTRIGRIGDAPAGFDTCLYKRASLEALAGVDVTEMSLTRLFDTARSGDRRAQRDRLHEDIASHVRGLAEVDTVQLQRSLDLKLALDEIRAAEKIDAFAIRCWPEAFTEYGGAVCGPVAILADAGVPCACEADVYGALTQIVLQRVADAPVFLTDLVDFDAQENTSVVWHCGQAPLAMRKGEATATIHSNRKMPLLFEFALKPGRVTFARLSQARGTQQLVIAGGEMLDRPRSFAGTSGVARFDTPADEMAKKIMASGLEHHMALAYGEHRPRLREVAAALDLPVLEL